jgi:hypothetical protein
MKTSRKRTVLVAVVVIVAGTCFALIDGCGNDVRMLEPNTSPAVISLTPSFLVAGATTTQTIEINGTGFGTSSSVAFNGAPRSVSFASSTQLSIALDQADLAVPGNYSVTVTNPSPGGGSASGTFSVWQPITEPSTGLNFAVPPFGLANQIDVDTSTPGPALITFSLDEGVGVFVPEFSLVVYANPVRLSLNQWFEQNVDVNGILITDNAVQQQTLSDSSIALVSSGAIPYAYFPDGGGPNVDDAYKLGSTGQVISIRKSQVSNLMGFGYPTAQAISQLELEILGTAHF